MITKKVAFTEADREQHRCEFQPRVDSPQPCARVLTRPIAPTRAGMGMIDTGVYCLLAVAYWNLGRHHYGSLLEREKR